MRYDEFEQKLREVKEDFRATHGRDVETLQELESFLRDRRLKADGLRKGRPTLKSLRGLGF
jgi:hypothetical protein